MVSLYNEVRNKFFNFIYDSLDGPIIFWKEPYLTNGLEIPLSILLNRNLRTPHENELRNELK